MTPCAVRYTDLHLADLRRQAKEHHRKLWHHRLEQESATRGRRHCVPCLTRVLLLLGGLDQAHETRASLRPESQVISMGRARALDSTTLCCSVYSMPDIYVSQATVGLSARKLQRVEAREGTAGWGAPPLNATYSSLRLDFEGRAGYGPKAPLDAGIAATRSSTAHS